MKRLVNLVFATALASSAQSAWPDEAAGSTAPEVRMENSEPYLNVAALESAVARHGFVSAAPQARGSESLLEILGLAGRGPFPSRGGPLD